ncbi:Phosphoglycerate mutase family [Pseudonocardia sp. Ae406_Ps2]|uniref:histidine phosphatase family protein n=1 Tax=unclassified Pseudonocardia TaxID=2619320 RepID=UPI0003116766|nr:MULTISPECIES: histidine phosphatase family protein [unclassified Pseudonocardia]OLL98029.1 Phosphoglycerate mutase family [Pseudonocardia sp. Ae331_Ps2]OLM04262.1 Phosphoglycerate mutase family [Pseudonocardia sp. Ae406_Ps2]OLM10903.1 Phosphoglycerate mutase family [Pseudonocardia sp. Ae505_Ps2]OLM25823.1 Phosphoglycerate mutase family [Pseudonocardia sp. Ae706_Ps2]OLM34041.1 Phosphoglycerate mutase family [Pseudonocardia sp. Ae717_Ps2]
MELIVVRHGRPETVQGHVAGADPGLTEEGRHQADLLAALLTGAAGLTPDRIVSSPMRRALQTAHPLAERTGLPVAVDDRLAEFDRGAHTYVPVELSGTDRAAQWRALESGVWGEHRFDPEAFEQRVLAAFEDVIAANPGQRVAVVCHGGVINAFLSRLLGRRRSMFVQLDYTSFSRLLASSGGVRQLRSINETPHLLLPATGPGLHSRSA